MSDPDLLTVQADSADSSLGWATLGERRVGPELRAGDDPATAAGEDVAEGAAERAGEKSCDDGHNQHETEAQAGALAPLLASLDGKANALVLRTDVLGEIAICQLEGSLTHTAYALLSDLITLRRREAPPAAPARRTL